MSKLPAVNLKPIWNIALVNAKAIAGAITAILVASLGAFGVEVPQDVEVAFLALVVAAVVWATPNKK